MSRTWAPVRAAAAGLLHRDGQVGLHALEVLREGVRNRADRRRAVDLKRLGVRRNSHRQNRHRHADNYSVHVNFRTF
jgi:hypothetical protein